MTKTKKSKNKKVVLASALLLAGVIAVGGTFAWFTSKNQVTNRLTASNSYGVSITESFTPPEQWTPGQNIDKEVAAVNTGNVAAYVKLDLTDEMSVTAETGVLVSTMIDGVLSTITSDDSYVVLSEDEVISIEAGGQLAYVNGLQKVVTTTTDAVTEAVTETITYQITANNTTTAIDTTVTAGEYYKTITTSGLYVFARTDLDGNTVYSGYYVAVDGSNKTFYKVDLSGLTLTETQNSSSASGSVTTTTYNIGRGDFNFVKEKTTAIDASTNSSLLLFSSTIFNTSGSYSTGSVLAPYGDGYTSTSTVYYIQAVYDPDYQTSDLTGNEWSTSTSDPYQRTYTNGSTYYYTDLDESNNIVINIALDRTWTLTSGTPDKWTSDNWTAVYDTATDDWTFYYNHVLSAGTTSKLLVTDMQLDTSVKNDAYTEFTYDLIVNLESVQVVAAETYENGITKIEIPSSSITWTQAVGTSEYDVSETATYGIYVNENGQVCVKNGTVTDGNNKLTWSFTAQ